MYVVSSNDVTTYLISNPWKAGLGWGARLINDATMNAQVTPPADSRKVHVYAG